MEKKYPKQKKELLLKILNIKKSNFTYSENNPEPLILQEPTESLYKTNSFQVKIDNIKEEIEVRNTKILYLKDENQINHEKKIIKQLLEKIKIINIAEQEFFDNPEIE